MKRPTFLSKTPRTLPAFTLVEMLVSMTILAALIILTGQLVKSVSTATTGIGKQMDDESQVRMVFDAMANDFSRMVLRDDVDYYFSKQAGNDKFYFFSEVPAYSATPLGATRSSVALVGYRVHPTTCQLERFSNALTWDGPGGITYLSYKTDSSGARSGTFGTITSNANWTSPWNTSLNATGTTDANYPYKTVSVNAYRMEITYLLTSGTISNRAYDPSRSPSDSNFFNMRDVSAVIVAIATLDGKSRQMIHNPDETVPNLIQYLPDAEATGNDIMATWANTLNNPENYLRNTIIPQAASAQTHIYQRYFFLNHQ